MKKVIVVLSSLLMVLAFASCGNKRNDDVLGDSGKGQKAVATERFEGLVPAADGPGIFYQVVLIRYQGKDSGIYHQRHTYIDGSPDGDLTFDTYGRFIISRRNGERVLRLTPFETDEEVMNFTMNDSAITMLDMQMNKIESSHNYTLKKIK